MHTASVTLGIASFKHAQKFVCYSNFEINPTLVSIHLLSSIIKWSASAAVQNLLHRWNLPFDHEILLNGDFIELSNTQSLLSSLYVLFSVQSLQNVKTCWSYFCVYRLDSNLYTGFNRSTLCLYLQPVIVIPGTQMHRLWKSK